MSNALATVEERIDGVVTRLDRVNERWDRIENRLVASRERDIERLSDDMRLAETKLGMT